MAHRDRDPRDIERLQRRIVLSIMGKEGHGKTDFYFTGPRPILALSVDPNTEDVACKIFGVDRAEDLDPEVCRLVHIPFPLVGFEAREDDIMEEAKESWYRLTDEISDVLHQRGKVQPRTVALDTGTELHTLNILKEFGRTDKLSPITRRNRMGAVNNDFKGIFRALEHAQVHVCVTHRVREHWETVEVRGRGGSEEKDQVVPGVFDRIGFKEIGNICNTEVLVKFDPDREGELVDRFGMEILRSMQRPGVVGDRYWGMEPVGEGRHKEEIRAASFPFLGTLLYPSTTLKDWS